MAEEAFNSEYALTVGNRWKADLTNVNVGNVVLPMLVDSRLFAYGAQSPLKLQGGFIAKVSVGSRSTEADF